MLVITCWIITGVIWESYVVFVWVDANEECASGGGQTALWVFLSPGGVPTVEIGADGVSRWKSQVEVW